MAKSKKSPSKYVEKIRSLSFERNLNDDELIELTDITTIRATGLPPHESATAAFSATVVDQAGNPVQGSIVSFAVSFVRPGGNWRSAGGMRALYGRSGAKAERLVNQGVIRVLGTVSSLTASTDSNGVATVTYRSSHIGSDLSQRVQAQEKITATLSSGAKKESLINVGWTGLKQIAVTRGGLRVQGATGRHVIPDLNTFLKNLGKSVKDAGWPHPVTVTAAALKWGGQYPPHFTHKHGATLDLRPMSTDGNPTWAKRDGTSKANYDFVRTKALITVLKDTGGKVKFNGKNTGGTYLAGHDNHIHVSWLTSAVTRPSTRTWSKIAAAVVKHA